MKRLLLILSCLFLIGCNHNNKQLDLYNRFIADINNYKGIYENNLLPFDIEIYFEKYISEEITYRVIIDNPKEVVRNIQAVAVHNYETDDIYPTTGIFEEPLNLNPNLVDVNSNYIKGIILVGYIDYQEDLESFDGVVKVLIEYDSRDGNHHKIYYK